MYLPRLVVNLPEMQSGDQRGLGCHCDGLDSYWFVIHRIFLGVVALEYFVSGELNNSLTIGGQTAS